MRKLMRRSSGRLALRASEACCISAAKLTAFTTLPNSARKPSPSVLTMRPLALAISGSMMADCRAISSASVPASSRSISRE